MWKYLMRRFAYMVFTVLVISVISFSVIQLPPGDYVTNLIQQMVAAGGNAMPSEYEQQLRDLYGLNQPMYVQYYKWISNIVLHGKFGYSLVYKRDAVDLITERLIADVSAVVRRFGAERVIAENNPPNADECLRPAYQPEVISNVVRETGCDLLLDLAHVRLAARTLGMDGRQYAEALPVERIRDIHVTGIQRIEARMAVVVKPQGRGAPIKTAPPVHHAILSQPAGSFGFAQALQAAIMALV